MPSSFTAVNFGKPCTMKEGDWEVKMVTNTDNTSIQCPGYGSMEILEAGTQEMVTIISYQRFKFRLYRITSNILAGFYSCRAVLNQESLTRLKAIKQELLVWESDLPPELRLTSFKTEKADLERDEDLKTFQLQALALQLIYDNVRLLLYRPILTCDRLSQWYAKSTETSQGDRSGPDSWENLTPEGSDLEFYLECKNQCWESAMQTSRIGEYPNLLRATRNTFIAPFMGFISFTAGAVFALFALSAPFSTTAQESKLALGRLIRMPQVQGYHTKLSDQSGNIMKRFLQRIFSAEMRLLTDNEDLEQAPQICRSVESVSPNPASDISSNATTDLRSRSRVSASLTSTKSVNCLYGLHRY